MIAFFFGPVSVNGVDCLALVFSKLKGHFIRLDPADGMHLAAKAERIVFADNPPARMSNEPSDFRCRFCSYFAVCHGCKIPEAHCRTCAHATPERDGTWSCAKGQAFGTVCEQHLFIPEIMPPDLSVVDAGPDFVDYEDRDTGEVFRNQANSHELHMGRMK